MKMKRLFKSLLIIVCVVLIAAMALSATGCESNKTTSGDASATPATTVFEAKENELGEGKNSFNFTVTDIDGNVTSFVIKTDKTIVGDALKEHNLIAGEEDQYGLYVKVVNGITADYDDDKTYWAFYVNGEYASKGVDVTEITEGATYSFKVEK